MSEQNPLWQDIKNFSKHKKKWGIALIILGFFGLILPVLPGVIPIAVGVLLIKPEWYDKFKSWFVRHRS